MSNLRSNMSNTKKTEAELLQVFADNNQEAIDAQDLRDFVVSTNLDETNAHLANKNNPHNTTAAQVGAISQINNIQGGKVTLVQGTGITITSNPVTRKITFTGTQGSQGLPGNGSQGFQGAIGTQGNQGLTGSGFQGDRGFQGFQGLVGTQGNQGQIGTQGNQGNQGFQGLIGNQGFQGFQGLVGTQGNQGFQGSGFQGNQGFQGLVGTQGNQGFQGSGFQGNQGFQGGTSAGGSDTEVQYNASNVLAGDANLIWDYTDGKLAITNIEAESTSGQVILSLGADIDGNAETGSGPAVQFIGNAGFGGVAVGGIRCVSDTNTTTQLVFSYYASGSITDFATMDGGDLALHILAGGNLTVDTGNATVNGQIVTPLVIASTAIDFNDSNIQQFTLSSGVNTLTFANPISGASYILQLIQPGGGDGTVSWPTITWQGGSPPTLTASASATDLIMLIYAGTTYYGSSSLGY